MSKMQLTVSMVSVVSLLLVLGMPNMTQAKSPDLVNPDINIGQVLEDVEVRDLLFEQGTAGFSVSGTLIDLPINTVDGVELIDCQFKALTIGPKRSSGSSNKLHFCEDEDGIDLVGPRVSIGVSFTPNQDMPGAIDLVFEVETSPRTVTRKVRTVYRPE